MSGDEIARIVRDEMNKENEGDEGNYDESTGGVDLQVGIVVDGAIPLTDEKRTSEYF